MTLRPSQAKAGGLTDDDGNETAPSQSSGQHGQPPVSGAGQQRRTRPDSDGRTDRQTDRHRLTCTERDWRSISPRDWMVMREKVAHCPLGERHVRTQRISVRLALQVFVGQRALLSARVSLRRHRTSRMKRLCVWIRLGKTTCSSCAGRPNGNNTPACSVDVGNFT